MLVFNINLINLVISHVKLYSNASTVDRWLNFHHLNCILRSCSCDGHAIWLVKHENDVNNEWMF